MYDYGRKRQIKVSLLYFVLSAFGRLFWIECSIQKKKKCNTSHILKITFQGKMRSLCKSVLHSDKG